MGIKKLFFAGVSLLVALAIVFPVVSHAALSGLDIMKKVDELPQGDDQKSTVTLRLISTQGQERKIATTRYWKNYRGKDGFYSKTLFFTDFPPDVKSTGFLIWDYSQEWKTCYVVESKPKEAGSAYSKRIFWVLKDDWRTVKIEYFDHKKDPLKVQT